MTDGDRSERAAPFSCVLIGEGSLLIQCGEILLADRHRIVRIVSRAPAIVEWATEHEIDHCRMHPDLADALGAEPFDYLFSITNLAIVPDDVLGLASRGAINFHDGPLPRYAGMHATSWALINQEREHGITWHEMVSDVDAGRIFAQERFAVDAADTAFTLNAKCYEAARSSFVTLVDDLATGRSHPVDQDSAGRSYFARNKRPGAAGSLAWEEPADSIDALVRGLDFGPYDNPLGLPKVRIGTDVYTVGDVVACSAPSGAGGGRPGTITHRDEVLRVAVGDGEIEVGRFADLNGNEISIAELAEQHALELGDVLPALDAQERTELTDLHERVCRHESFWRDQLRGLEPVALPIPDRGDRSATPAGSTMSVRRIAERTVEGIASVDRAAAPADLASAVLLAFLARSTGAEDYAVRFTHRDLRAIVGRFSDYFETHVPLRVSTTLDRGALENLSSIITLLERSRGKETFARDLPLRCPELDPQSWPVAPVVLDHVGDEEIGDDEIAGDHDPAPGSALIFRVDADGGVTWIYDRAIYADADIDRLQDQFDAFVDSLAAGGSTPLRATSLLSADTREQLLRSWNRTEAAYDDDACVHELITEQMRRTPDRVALVVEDDQLTYRELDEKANQLARTLRKLGVGPGAFVGVYLERSLDMLVGLLAVLKAGGAYVPLDPSYPTDRLRFMVDDAQIAVLLTQNELVARLPSHDPTLLTIDGSWDLISLEDAGELERSARPDDLAYMIYTSGSTGRPKGVMIEHRNVINFFAGMDRCVPHDRDDPGTWLAATSISFDISVLELFWTLARGFHVVLHKGDRHGSADALEPAGRRAAHTRPLDFGLFYFASDEDEQEQSRKYDLLLDGARFADENGFSSIWTPERHFHRFGGLYPNPSVAGAALAAITDRVDIRAGSCVLPLHDPIRVAEEWSLVDNLSNGRVGISFAAGWQPNDFVLNPEGFATRTDDMFRDIEVVRRLWRGEQIDFPGPTGEHVAIRTLPRPVQDDLPVWITIAGNPESYRRAGAGGYNVLTHLLGQTTDELGEKIALYRAARRDAGHDGDGYVTVMLHTFIGDDIDAVRDIVRGPMKSYLRSAVGLIEQAAWNFPTIEQRVTESGRNPLELLDSDEISEADFDALLDFAFERYFRTSGLFGTPESCLEMTEKMREIGADEIACLVDFGVPVDTATQHFAQLAELRASATRAAGTVPRSIPALIAEHQVTHFQCTPSQARMLVLDPEGRTALGRLDALLVGGEELAIGLAQELAELVGGRVVNMYGPTETTIWSTSHELVDPVDHVSIGRPIANTELYILDERLEPVPTGMIGELYIGGDGVARGYHRRAETTAERFVAHPFDPEPGSRLYRTGDLARYREDGVVDFLGRADHQVKIRGHRIELGEIEATLGDHPAVLECVVVAREDVPGNRQLVAYVRSAPGAGVEASALKAHLAATLPDIMVPAHYVALDALPLTPNGKVDRLALPAPSSDRPDDRDSHVAPSSAAERALASIWSASLGVEHIGVNDDFFDLGGHSLLAIEVVARVRLEFGVELSMQSIFETPTIAALAPLVESSVSEDRDTDAAADHARGRQIERHERDDGVFPLSAAQKRLWFLQGLEPEMFVYNMPKAFRLRGPLDVDALHHSLRDIVERHGSLRTTFGVGDDGVPFQRVSERAAIDLPVTDLSHLAPEHRQATVDLLLTEEARQPFDLSSGPLIRVLLLRLDAREYVFMYNMHHVISDGWSLGVLYRELAQLYEARVAGIPDTLPALPVQYVDFSRWQEERLQSAAMQDQLTFWRDQLRDAPPLLELPTDHSRPTIQSYRGARVLRRLPDDAVNGVAEVSARYGVTPFMTYLAAFATLLHRYSGRDDIVIGSPIAGRNHPDVEHLVGFFVNTLALRTNLEGDPPFGELLRQIKATSVAAFDNQDYPFEQLVAHLAPERSRAFSPLFQAMFILQNTPEQEGLSLGELRVDELEVDHGAAKFDLTLEVLEKPGGHELLLEYDTALFQVSTALRIVDHFDRLLAAAVAAPEEPISSLPMLADDERARLVDDWNDTRADYPGELLLHELFDRQVELTPDRPAAIFDHDELTYRDLQVRANQVANHLLSVGVRPGDLIALCARQSPDVLVGIVGILKAGCAYLPLDPSYPAERLAFMLEDSGVAVLLTQEALLDDLPAHEAHTICLDRDRPSIARAGDDSPPRSEGSSEAAYVVYTSGSTGRPKGVLGLHRATVNRCQWMWDAYPFDDGDRCCQKTSLSFVDSVWEIFGPLLRGVPTVYLDSDVLVRPTEFVRVLAQQRVTRVLLIPSFLEALLDGHRRLAHELPDLRLWVCSGEALSVDLARDFAQHMPDHTLLNLYGSSEVAGDVTYYEVANAHQLTTVPIGRPIANTQIYLLDPAMQPVPVGVTGAIWVGGDGLAGGYLHRPDLTAERFVDNPIDAATSPRLYRTGDLGRYRPDGQIEYVGREDDQVNVRGFRVELGEIEDALRHHPSVRDAVVGVRTDGPGGPRIVAYATVEEGATVDPLRESLAARLPGYMMPAAFVLLDEFPLTPNGKVDRLALARLEVSAGDDRPHREARTRLERSLVDLFEELLGAESIGIDDNFFELGGHSLLGVELLAQIRELTGTELPFSALFDAPTVAELASELGDTAQLVDVGGPSSEAATRDGPRWAPSVVPIRPTGSERTFFHIGGVALLHKIRDHLGADQPIFSISEQPLDDSEPLFTDMDAVVEYCVTGLRSVQPEGPYLLGGLCFGGFVALEVARALRQEGDRVDTLFIVEAYVPGSVRPAGDGAPAQFRFGSVANHYVDAVRRDGAGYIVGTARNKLRSASWRMANWGAQRTGVGLPKRFRNIVEANNHIADRYSPEPYDGRVVLVEVEELDERFTYPSYLGWQDYLTGDITVHRVPGGHLTAYEEPHVGHLAARLADELALHRLVIRP